MPNITITIDDREVMDALKGLQARLGDLTPAMRTVARMMESAVQRNFAEGGRPDKWKPSKRALRQNGQTLMDTGRLKNSITSRSDATSAEVGTNVEYAAIHQFGGRTKPTIIRPKNKKALSWPGARHPVMMVKYPIEMALKGKALIPKTLTWLILRPTSSHWEEKSIMPNNRRP
ncbi:MAG: phage virion morphogenesis protein [Dissulfurimicrobium sp.]